MCGTGGQCGLKITPYFFYKNASINKSIEVLEF